MAKKKSKKKLFIIAGLVLIGVVAVGGYQMMMGSKEGEPSKPDVSSELGFIGLDPFLAPVIEGRRIAKYVAVGVVLELYNVDHKPLIRKYVTPLRNAFIDDFVFQAQMNSGTSESIHLKRVKTRFHTLADRIVGPDIVKEILISHVIDRGF